MSWFKKIFGSSSEKTKVETTKVFTQKDFELAHPDFSLIEVKYIGLFWQTNRFKQADEWNPKSNFVEDYIIYKKEYISLCEKKNQSYRQNDILWAFYNKYKGTYIKKMMKRGGWDSFDVKLFNIANAEEAKDFKWQEKICAFDEQIEKIHSEIQQVRAKLKTLNAELKKAKNEALLKEKKQLKKEVEKLTVSRDKIIERREKFVKSKK